MFMVDEISHDHSQSGDSLFHWENQGSEHPEEPHLKGRRLESTQPYTDQTHRYPNCPLPSHIQASITVSVLPHTQVKGLPIARKEPKQPKQENNTAPQRRGTPYNKGRQGGEPVQQPRNRRPPPTGKQKNQDTPYTDTNVQIFYCLHGI